LGLTLVAILTAALLLPGIVAARFFFRAADTAEIEVPVPSLSSPEGIALVGGFSVLVHFVYSVGLWAATALPTLIPLPLADPYALFAPAPGRGSPDAALGLFAGLLGLCLTAIATGYVAGRVMLRRDKSFFYGPLTELLQAGEGDDKFITAYVISKLQADGKAVGYEGTIAALHRDGDGYPDKVVLKDVAPFSLTQKDDGSTREEGPQVIDWLVLSAADWHNIAFRVFRVEGEQEAREPPPG
jgi:hypothetical protein